MTGINKWVKAAVLDFQGTVLLCSKGGEWVTFWPQINILDLKVGKSGVLLYPKCGKYGIFGPKIVYLNFSINLLFRFFLKFSLMTDFKK